MMNPSTIELYQKGADARTKRGVRAAVSVACLLCATYSLGLGLPVWPLVGLPMITAALFIGAGVGMFSVIWR